MKKIGILLIASLLAFTGLALASIEFVYKVANLDFPLYKNERYWGGSKEAELVSFLEGGRRVHNAQIKIARSQKSAISMGRVFHRKSLGCVTGKLILRNSRPTDTERATFVGLFDPSIKESYDVVVRFSNGVGFSQADKFPDVRGAAIKIFDVFNSTTGKNQTVDFLMTNSPKPFGKDFLEFATFMDLVADHGPNLGGLLFAPHLKAGLALTKASGLPVVSNYKIKSIATERFWSGHPYLLGANRAMKFNIIPTETYNYPKSVLKVSDNYLQKDLEARLLARSVTYTFAIQLEQDSNKTPIEDNLAGWSEKDAPSIPVADLVLDQQDASLKSKTGFCENFRFTPGHYIPEHRPLSNMGRGRLFGYEASQIGRSADENEPDHSIFGK